MAYVDPDFDWTKGEARDVSASMADGGGDLIDYEISEDAVAPVASAEDIERDSGFKPIPVGDNQELVVLGFLMVKDSDPPSPITRMHKDCFFGERRESYSFDAVTVKLGLVSDTSCQVTEWFALPPGDPHDLKCYYEANSKPGNNPRTKGFDCRKTFQFLERLGFVWPRGGKLPPEARQLRNWVGRKIMADIVKGDDYIKKVFDKESGMKIDKVFPGRSQVKLFTYRPHPETIERFQRAAQLAPPVAASNTDGRQTTGQTPVPATPRRPASSPKKPTVAAVAPAGLDEI